MSQSYQEQSFDKVQFEVQDALDCFNEYIDKDKLQISYLSIIQGIDHEVGKNLLFEAEKCFHYIDDNIKYTLEHKYCSDFRMAKIHYITKMSSIEDDMKYLDHYIELLETYKLNDSKDFVGKVCSNMMQNRVLGGVYSMCSDQSLIYLQALAQETREILREKSKSLYSTYEKMDIMYSMICKARTVLLAMRYFVNQWQTKLLYRRNMLAVSKIEDKIKQRSKDLKAELQKLEAKSQKSKSKSKELEILKNKLELQKLEIKSKELETVKKNV